MGITTPLSTNPSMTIGGLTIGVTPLDMAHAYETIAHGGDRVTGTLVEDEAPVGIQEVKAASQPLPDGSRADKNRVRTHRILPAAVASTETSMLETVIQYGTGRAAAIGQFAAGKTGTTTNYGDAWFVGWDSKFTVAVWVGYPDKLIPMTTNFNNGPVLGGTFPALIWHDFMTSALQIELERSEHSSSKKGTASPSSEVSTTASPAVGTPKSSNSPSSKNAGPATPNNGKGGAATPSAPSHEAGEAHSPEHAATPATPGASEPAPATPAPATPSPTPTPPASSTPSQTGGVGPAG